MKNKVLILLLSLLGVVSCHREEAPASGSLRIVFETEAFQTKSGVIDPVEDGSAIYVSEGVPDLVILIANNSTGNIVATYPDGPDGPMINGALEGTPTSTKSSVSFSGLTGNLTYTVYAFANTQGLWTIKSGESTVSSLLTLTTQTQVEALQFEPIPADKDACGCLAIKNGRMPLSAQGETTLTALGNGEISLALKRCVAKVTAVFENQYGENLTLTSFSNTFYHMNPGTSYVVPHANDFPVEQEDANDGNITATQASLSIADNGTYSTSWYVFPSIGPYTCDVIFTMDALEHRYINLPVHDDHARDITQLARNQHLTITTRIGKGKQVSFNFEVQDWGEKTERVTFN